MGSLRKSVVILLLIVILSTSVLSGVGPGGGEVELNNVACRIRGDATYGETQYEIAPENSGPSLDPLSPDTYLATGGNSCTLSCFDFTQEVTINDKPVPLLRKACFAEDNYTFYFTAPTTQYMKQRPADVQTKHLNQIDLPLSPFGVDGDLCKTVDETMIPGYGSARTIERNDNVGVVRCALPKDSSGGKPEENPQKCAGVVQPETASIDDSAESMEKSIKNTWRGSNLCCGNDALDLGMSAEGDTEACLLNDENFDANPDSGFVSEDWFWRKASTEKFHIFNVNKSGEDYDIVSNGKLWFQCADANDIDINSKFSTTLLDDLESPDATEEDDNIQSESSSFFSAPTATTPTGSTDSNFVVIPYGSEFGLLTLLDIENDPNSQILSNIILDEKQNNVELTTQKIIVNPSDKSSSQISKAFVCSNQNDYDRIFECCGEDLRNCVNNCDGDLPCERVKRQGESTSTVFDFNFFRTKTNQNQVGIFRVDKQQKHNNEISVTNNKVKFGVRDFSGYDNLEMFIGFARSPRLRLNLIFEDKDGNSIEKKISGQLIDYSLNGEQPLTWHHIRIPLVNLNLEVGMKIKEFYFYTNYDFDAKERGKVKLSGENLNYYNVYFVDRIKVTNNEQKYCTHTRNWVSDMDESDGQLACMETPGHLWMTDADDNINNRCCGDDKDEIQFGGKYGGCIKGIPVLNNSRITNLRFKMKSLSEEERTEICTRNDCYFNIPTRHISNQVEIINEENISTLSLSYSDGEKIQNGLKTTNMNESIRFSNVPLQMLYFDNELLYCEGASDYNQPSGSKEANYCSVNGNYFCSYGDNVNNTIKQRSEWSNKQSGTSLAINRSSSNTLPEELRDELFNTTIKGYRESGCCLPSSCWDGTTCVEGIEQPYDKILYGTQYSENDYTSQHSDAFSSYFGYNNESNEFSQYICVKEKVGNNFEASWKKSYYKERWDNSSNSYQPNGYCLQDSQCWTGRECVNDGWYTHKESTFTNYTDDNNNPTSTEGDYYCEKGQWTSRTKLVAENLLTLAGEDDYSLHCDDIAKASNNLDLPINLDFTKFNSLCALKYKDGVAMGLSLNFNITQDQTILQALSVENLDSCHSVKGEGYKPCSGNNKLWYDAKLQSLIYSQHIDVSFSNEDLTQIFLKFFSNPGEAASNFIKKYIRPISVGEVDLSFIDGIDEFSKFYSARSGEKKVFAVLEKTIEKITSTNKEIGKFLTVQYENFNADVCEAINKYQAKTNFNLFCQPLTRKNKNDEDEVVFVAYGDKQESFDKWIEMTAELRLENIEKIGESPNAKINSPVDGQTYFLSENIDFIAELDNDVQSYYWDLDTGLESVKGQKRGIKFTEHAQTAFTRGGYFNITLFAITSDGGIATNKVSICINDPDSQEYICDADVDGDTICDTLDAAIIEGAECTAFEFGGEKFPDNCPQVSNILQENEDFFAEPKPPIGVPGFTYAGDACDIDKDNDGVSNEDEVTIGSDPNDNENCGDRDKDGCDDCSSGNPLQKYVQGQDVVVYSKDNFGSENEPDTDNDGICDKTDEDDDNDNVLDAEDKIGDVSYATDKMICGDSDNDGCDDCFHIGKLIIEDGKIYQDGDDADYDGLCDEHDTDCVDLDGDGFGLAGTNLAGCSNSQTQEDKKEGNKWVCGDKDGDGCEDCASGTYIEAMHAEIAGQVVIHSGTLGSELGLDTDGDGFCDEGGDYFEPPNVDSDDDNDNAPDTEDRMNGVDYSKDKTRCGDVDNDGCDDCSKSTPRISHEKDGETVVHSYDTIATPGSEAELDIDGDGMCNLVRGPFTVNIAPQDYILESDFKINIKATSDRRMKCKYHETTFDYYTQGTEFEEDGKVYEDSKNDIDVSQVLRDKIFVGCDSLNPFFPICVGLTTLADDYYDLVDSEFQDMMYLAKAITSDDSNVCKQIRMSGFRSRCEDYVTNKAGICTGDDLISDANTKLSMQDANGDSFDEEIGNMCRLFDAIKQGKEEVCTGGSVDNPALSNIVLDKSTVSETEATITLVDTCKMLSGKKNGQCFDYCEGMLDQNYYVNCENLDDLGHVFPNSASFKLSKAKDYSALFAISPSNKITG